MGGSKEKVGNYGQIKGKKCDDIYDPAQVRSLVSHFLINVNWWSNWLAKN